jgi:hypothetical protein
MPWAFSKISTATPSKGPHTIDRGRCCEESFFGDVLADLDFFERERLNDDRVREERGSEEGEEVAIFFPRKWGGTYAVLLLRNGESSLLTAFPFPLFLSQELKEFHFLSLFELLSLLEPPRQLDDSEPRSFLIFVISLRPKTMVLTFGPQ